MKDCTGCPRFEAKRATLASIEAERTQLIAVVAGTARLVKEMLRGSINLTDALAVNGSVDQFVDLVMPRAEAGKDDMVNIFAREPHLKELHFKMMDSLDSDERQISLDIETLQQTCAGPGLITTLDGVTTEPTIFCTAE